MGQKVGNAPVTAEVTAGKLRTLCLIDQTSPTSGQSDAEKKRNQRKVPSCCVKGPGPVHLYQSGVSRSCSFGSSVGSGRSALSPCFCGNEWH